MTSLLPRRRLLFLAACCIILIVFVRSLPNSRSPQQIEFDKWLSGKEKILAEMAAHSADRDRGSRENAAVPLPILSLEMQNSTGVGPYVYKFVTTENPGVIERSVRLLQLMREGDIFTIGDELNLGGRPVPHVLLTVQDGEKVTFRTAFRESDVGGNPQALLLLKLFLQYATPPSAEEISRP